MYDTNHGREHTTNIREIDEQILAELAAAIERCRLELNDLGAALGERHPDVLAKSQLLDELILQHMKTQMKSKKPTA